MIEHFLTLLKLPRVGWMQINRSTVNSKNIFTGLFIPALIITCIIKVCGRIFIAEDISVLNGILDCSAFIIINSVVIYISSWVLSKLLKKFGSEKSMEQLLIVCLLAAIPYLFISTLAGLHQAVKWINIVQIYPLIIFWQGIPEMIQVKKEQQTGFILVSLLMIAVVSLIINFLVMSVFFPIFTNF